MTALLLAALGLGLAGMDPAGALVGAATLAAGARRRTVLVYGLVVLGGSAAMGATLSLTVGLRLRSLDLLGLLPRGGLGALVEVLLGASLLGWAGWRRRPAVAGPARAGRSGLVPVLGLGLAYASLSLADPTFAAMVVLAGRGQAVVEVVLAHVMWSLTSQLPLVVLLVAVVAGVHDGAVTWFRRGWARVSPVLHRVVTAVLLVAGGLLLADAVLFLATGRFAVG
ncbi:hypothetical protein RHODO2019_12640 [Rhodococcus antarcticus]|uniref:Sap-like sulfolipid-1-addressing protein n=1 Tax=Rhodococcus antarcticus TaxID=2987751 RepID=A0ABY6NXA2_9NOCA|nr:hypothetical protein [Rhodococcus antarcticus]UZJ24024.1 hypothetical protein RHODO2019_12640 [Rhodococcus antarcticus]